MKTRESVIIKFVKDNLRLLQQKDFLDEVYKQKKHDYFYEVRKFVRNPKNSEIAQVAVLYMIRKYLIHTEEELNNLLERPFFENNIYESKILFESLKLKNKNTFMVIDPTKLENLEYREKIENEIKAKILAESQPELLEQKEKFKKEIDDLERQLATIPTKLQKQDYDEPEIAKENLTSLQEWWQQLNLEDDPFPLAEGLKKINDSMYESIIVRTEIFKKYMNFTDNLKQQIFKNTIFYGDFGSGKTAFFDYLTKILLRNRVLSVSVPLWASKDVSVNIFNFENKLLTSLTNESKEYSLILEQDDKNSSIQKIKEILIQLTKQKNFNGLVIFIDDLHKNPKAFDAVLDFLSYLQIFTSEMIEDGLNTAVYVAGIPQWKSKIAMEPRLSGSLIREETMPEIKEEDAYEMLNNRMITFSKNKNKKNIIGRVFVKKIYDDLKQKNMIITFREFLRKALEEFTNGNFDTVLTINPKAIPLDILDEIKKSVLSRPKLSYQIEHLSEITADADVENKQKCFELLGDLHLEHGLYENSPLIERNIWALNQLKRSGLINVFRDLEGIKWLVNRELIEVNNEIVVKYNVSLEDYLVPAFIGNPIYRKKSTKTREYEILEKLAKKTKDETAAKILLQTLEDYKPLLAIEKEHSLNIAPKDLVNQCKKSLNTLTHAFMVLENISIPQDSKEEKIGFWKDFWHNPSPLIEFVNYLENSPDVDMKRANFIFGIYKEAFTELVVFLKNQTEKDKSFSISYDNLTRSDCKVLDLCRELWMDKEYFVMCETIVKYLERKLRSDVYNIFTLLYGDRDNRMKQLDPKINNEINKNIKNDEQKGFALIKNEFQYLNRKDYKILLTSGPPTQPSEIGHGNWENIFKEIFKPWNESRLYNFLDLFGNYNTVTSHNKTESITESQQPDLRQFVTDSMFFLQKFNGSYKKIIDNYIIQDSKLFFNVVKSNPVDQNPVLISSNDFSDFIKKLSNLDEIAIPIQNNKEIEIFYNIEYRKVIMMLAMLLNGNDQMTQKFNARLYLTGVNDLRYSFELNITNKI
ncbi:MAG: hypothetical protein EPO37_09455 [Nitrosarchaeum sp.]|nr:MAG: hypothetical protein EPO37_09455 [Nitrosarchaeum sp.]